MRVHSFLKLLGCMALTLNSFPLCVFAESQSRTVQVTATILPRLELSINPSTGSSIAFGAIAQPNTGSTNTKTVAVNLSVFSNLDRPYHVTQTVRHPLTATSGTTIPDEQLQIITRNASQGEVGLGTLVPVASGTPTTLYTSNAHGKSDAFVADYQLSVTPTTPAGDFGTEILYTVTSL